MVYICYPIKLILNTNRKEEYIMNIPIFISSKRNCDIPYFRACGNSNSNNEHAHDKDKQQERKLKLIIQKIIWYI